VIVSTASEIQRVTRRRHHCSCFRMEVSRVGYLGRRLSVLRSTAVNSINFGAAFPRGWSTRRRSAFTKTIRFYRICNSVLSGSNANANREDARRTSRSPIFIWPIAEGRACICITRRRATPNQRNLNEQGKGSFVDDFLGRPGGWRKSRKPVRSGTGANSRNEWRKSANSSSRDGSKDTQARGQKGSDGQISGSKREGFRNRKDRHTQTSSSREPCENHSRAVSYVPRRHRPRKIFRRQRPRTFRVFIRRARVCLLTVQAKLSGIPVWRHIRQP
jgi:hypothetical protein